MQIAVLFTSIVFFKEAVSVSYDIFSKLSLKVENGPRFTYLCNIDNEIHVCHATKRLC